MYNNSTSVDGRQAQRIFSRLVRRRAENAPICAHLRTIDGPDGPAARIADQIEDCGTIIQLSQIEDRTAITGANFCRRRLCSICAWRRQSRMLAQWAPVEQRLRSHDIRYIFITLTARNVDGAQAPGAVRDMQSAWGRLSRRAIFRPILGYIRTVEMTYNQDAATYHPHIHCLAVVPAHYFRGRDYITSSALRDAWRAAGRYDYDPIIDIRAVDMQTERSAALETLKYALKWRQLGSGGPEVVRTYMRALHGARLVSFGGIIRTIRAELALPDIEDDYAAPDAAAAATYPTILYRLDTSGGLGATYTPLRS